ncbi:MAG TPA: TylF/MycF/NovP-related O-methyltransferase [Caulobacteraceae bacterium]|nr:TylF/MycF/NovP-related O-methyltransferase [Caulobacteraceae bacterium]
MAVKGPFLQRLLRRLVYAYYGRNILFELQLRARSQSADYAEANMAEATIFEDADAFRLDCLRRAPAGAILEFGVLEGRSISKIAKAAPAQIVHGFDSFEGLPDDWAGHLERKGAFTQKGRLPKVPPNVRLHPGWFKDTIPAWLAADPSKIGFMHVDCDIYASARDVLWGTRERLQLGSIIVFDEYFNYPGWRSHEFRALQEFRTEFGLDYRYIAYTALGGSVAVEVTSLG